MTPRVVTILERIVPCWNKTAVGCGATAGQLSGSKQATTTPLSRHDDAFRAGNDPRRAPHGVDPFDQPAVELAKVITRERVAALKVAQSRLFG
jgi:hypothetical protein